MKRRTNNLLWLAAYLVTMAALVTGWLYARQSTISELSRPESLAQWRRWKDETQRQAKDADSGPIAREPANSDEPPALILLRDYFGAILAVSLLIGSYLFGFLMVAIRGACMVGRRAPPVNMPTPPTP